MKQPPMKRGAGLTGERYGRLVVVSEVESSGYHRRWLCRCDCGTVKAFDQGNLRSGASKSCGCLKRDQNVLAKFSRTHGMNKTPEHRAWSSMIQRCTNDKQDSWEDYGGRGIRVCERWIRNFEAFFADMGPRPSPMHTLDRKDANGNYEPGNCRWATRAQQAHTRRSTVLDWDIVDEIRGRHEHGEPNGSIARRLGIRSTRISAIVSNKAWKEEARPV